MKLSKKDLRRALQGEEEALVNDGLFPNRFGNAVQALNEGDLEIEGYERAQWTKFDQNDEATHPPKTDEYLVALDGWAFAQAVIFYKSNSAFDTREDVTHWRPLPKPPKEMEENDGV